uniref:Reverse transcriptase domain-containing protein n=1 Tax=Cannabis sativa TaxID=3483 RepID=A0A803NVG0_CANSA
MGKEGVMALKLDLSKAYDRVEWIFLEQMMLQMGLSRNLFHLLWSGFNNKYKITHGGHNLGPIIPSRGIRQGDPLSPYLFLICAEGFSSLVQRYVQNRWLSGCRVARGAPIISHMLFADDSYVYCKANGTEAANVLHLLSVYERASGQKVNFDKSSVFFSNNTRDDVREYICSFLGVSAATENSTYLGLPCTMGRSKNAILGFLKEKMRKKILSWETRFLSKAGKEVCSKGVSWMSWNKLSRHKDVGGLGFRNLRDYNLAFLGKQGWRLLTNENSLVSKLYKARYFPNGDFLSAEMGSNPSFIWRSIWEAKSLVKMGARRAIGDGKLTAVIGVPWLPGNENKCITTVHPSLKAQVGMLFEVLTRCCSKDNGQVDHWGGGTPDFAIWFGEALLKDTLTVMEERAMVTWRIWLARNDILWNNKTTTAFEVVRSARTNLDSWKNAQVQRTAPLLNVNYSNGREHWMKPMTHKFKINVDRAIFEAENCFGIGCVIRDQTARLVEAISVSKHGGVTPEIAEAIGVKEALSWIKKKALSDVEIETDSLVVVQAINGGVTMTSQFGALACGMVLGMALMGFAMLAFSGCPFHFQYGHTHHYANFITPT